jgi:hypothetical protein
MFDGMEYLLVMALAVTAQLFSPSSVMSGLTASTHHGDSPALVTKEGWMCGTPDRAAEAKSLVPGAPCVIELSRYQGISDARLVGRSVVRSRSTVGRLTTEFNGLPPIPMGTYSCPDDNGSKVVAILKYRTGQSLRLAITLSGCPVAKRGSVTRSALGSVGDRLTSELERLTPSSR